MDISLLQSDALETLLYLPDDYIQCCITSPPYYGLRDYKDERQLGNEKSPSAYIDNLTKVFREVRRVLKHDGTLWLNIGDSYKPKDLMGIPWRLALSLRSDEWYLRQDIIWHKPNPMPESVCDRCTKAHEYIFLLSKSDKYYFDHEAMREPAVKGYAGSQFHTGKTGGHQMSRASSKPRMTVNGGTRNRRSVWTIASQPYKGPHYAVFPKALVEPCILAGSREGDTVLDPFCGTGTVGLVCASHNRNFIGIDLCIDLAEKRISENGYKVGVSR